jgi:CheY-like chemotaxis protein
MKIILVDDDQDDRQAFAEAIKKLNIPVAHIYYAKDSKELFGQLEEDSNFHLVLLDINMPVKDGKQCLKDLKTDSRYQHIPVIIYTVSVNEKDIHESYEYGAHHYVVKPYAQINYHNTLRTIFNIDWKTPQPVPKKEHFVINNAYTI